MALAARIAVSELRPVASTGLEQLFLAATAQHGREQVAA